MKKISKKRRWQVEAFGILQQPFQRVDSLDAIFRNPRTQSIRF